MATLKVGEPAPSFEMTTTRNMEKLDTVERLEDFRGKWLVMFFYPLDFTFVCPTEITGFSDRMEDFKKLGAEVLGVSTDSVFSHRAWQQLGRGQGGLGELNFPLAADTNLKTSSDYGVLIEDKGIALRGLFVIDPDAVLQYQVVHNLNVGRSVDEILRVLEGLQSGGLCPVNWKPGQKLLKA